MTYFFRGFSFRPFSNVHNDLLKECGPSPIDIVKPSKRASAGGPSHRTLLSPCPPPPLLLRKSESGIPCLSSPRSPPAAARRNPSGLTPALSNRGSAQPISASGGQADRHGQVALGGELDASTRANPRGCARAVLRLWPAGRCCSVARPPDRRRPPAGVRPPGRLSAAAQLVFDI